MQLPSINKSNKKSDASKETEEKPKSQNLSAWLDNFFMKKQQKKRDRISKSLEKKSRQIQKQQEINKFLLESSLKNKALNELNKKMALDHAASMRAIEKKEEIKQKKEEIKQKKEEIKQKKEEIKQVQAEIDGVEGRIDRMEEKIKNVSKELSEQSIKQLQLRFELDSKTLDKKKTIVAQFQMNQAVAKKESLRATINRYQEQKRTLTMQLESLAKERKQLYEVRDQKKQLKQRLETKLPPI